MAASNKSHDGGVNKRDAASATERDKDRAVYTDPDIRGVRKGRREAHERPDTPPERATTHRDLRGRG
jgi:hypothetical protein